MTHQPLPLFGLDEIRPLVPAAPDECQAIQDRFEAFHELNPWVLRHLEELTSSAIDRGFQRIGIGMLFELLRYRYGEATRGDEFRLNNDFRSRYVRLLTEDHPEWRPYFELRALRAA